MPSAAFKTAADDSRKLKAKPSNEELLEVSQPLPSSYIAPVRDQGGLGIAEGKGGLKERKPMVMFLRTPPTREKSFESIKRRHIPSRPA